MAFSSKTSFLVEPSDGASVNFKDITGNTSPTSYDNNGNIDYGDVKGVRIKIAQFSNLIAGGTVLAAGDEFTQFAEYLKIAGDDETINDKTFTVGDYFVPQVADLTTALDDAWESTGYYVPQILDTWLPTEAETALNIDLDELNQPDNTEVAVDGYTYDYSIFDNEHTSNFAAVADQTYMVVEGESDYDGNTYYAGEIFTALDTSTITAGASNRVVELYETKTFYALCAYAYYQRLDDLTIQALTKTCDCAQQSKVEVTQQYDALGALSNMSATSNVAMVPTQDSLIKIGDKISQLENCSC